MSVGGRKELRRVVRELLREDRARTSWPQCRGLCLGSWLVTSLSSTLRRAR